VTTLDDVIASRGGNPLIVGGKVIGAIGVSGGTGWQDDVVSQAGVAALQSWLFSRPFPAYLRRSKRTLPGQRSAERRSSRCPTSARQYRLAPIRLAPKGAHATSP